MTLAVTYASNTRLTRPDIRGHSRTCNLRQPPICLTAPICCLYASIFSETPLQMNLLLHCTVLYSSTVTQSKARLGAGSGLRQTIGFRPALSLAMWQGSAMRDTGPPRRNSCAGKSCGTETYGKGPDSSSPGPCVWRVATFVALTIQLITHSSPVAHQSTNHRDILERSQVTTFV